MNKIDQNLIEKFKKGEELFSKKNFDESILNYKEILNSNPSFLPALNNIALCYENLNKLAEAEAYYYKCFSLKLDEITFINNLSNIYLKQKKFNKALPLLKKSLEINQNQLKIVQFTAMCLIDLNERKEAAKFCVEKLKAFPNDRILIKVHGRNLINLNKHKEGLAIMKKGSGFIELEGDKTNIIIN